MKRLRIRAAIVLLVALSISSCIHQPSPELRAARSRLTTLLREQEAHRLYTPESYEHFVSHGNYPVNVQIYKNPELLARADKRSRVVICLEQQRGRLYVDNQVAADWPVSTGVTGHETPPGTYSVLEKKEEYSSNRYGKIYDAKGRCINGDADIFTQEIPEGCRFEGSGMPFWMRLTWDGVGMHIGKVAAGKPLSHGCIRTPRAMAEDLYNIVGFGTKVAILEKMEPWYPARAALEYGKTENAREKRIFELRQKVYRLTQQEQQQRRKR